MLGCCLQRSDWEAVVKRATEEKDKWQREMLDKVGACQS